MTRLVLVIAAVLGFEAAPPALAQTSTWDFSPKAPATAGAKGAPEGGSPKEAAPAKPPTPVKEKPAARPAAARATKPAAGSAPVRDAPAPRPTFGVPWGDVILRWGDADPSAAAVDSDVKLDWPAEPENRFDFPDVVPLGPSIFPSTAPVPDASGWVDPRASARPVAARRATPIEVATPQPTGLERLGDEWPQAVAVGVQYRARAEEQRALSITDGPGDGYDLNRIRLEGTVRVAPSLRALGPT
jgi:hypothetical protein